MSVVAGLGTECSDLEGRVLTADFGTHYIVNVYTPNSGAPLSCAPPPPPPPFDLPGVHCASPCIPARALAGLEAEHPPGRNARGKRRLPKCTWWEAVECVLCLVLAFR